MTLPPDKIVEQNYQLYFVTYSERMGYLYERWIEIRCGTCKTTKTCEEKVEKTFQGCDKWEME